MKKVIHLEGMTCGHCRDRVETALNDITGVKAKVDLVKKQAVVSSRGEVSDEILRQTVEDAGYRAISIEEKKGFFG